jgi:nitrogen fixation NifU-like protein
MKVCIVALHGHIQAAAFEANGCAPTIAAGSVVTEWARDRSVEEAGVLTAAMVEDLMDGLPRVKRHCADLAARALRNAVADYNRRQA